MSRIAPTPNVAPATPPFGQARAVPLSDEKLGAPLRGARPGRFRATIESRHTLPPGRRLGPAERPARAGCGVVTDITYILTGEGCRELTLTVLDMALIPGVRFTA